MKSRIYSSDILKSRLSSGGFLPILFGVGYLLAFPVAELLMIGSWIQRGYNREQVFLLSENLYRDGLFYTGLVVTVGTAFLIALWNYFYLYSRDKVDYYHSQPVSRPHLFWQKLITGLVYFLIPYVLMLLFTLAAAGLRGYFQKSMFALALVMLLKHLIAWLFTYFCTVLVICMTGNVLMGVLSFWGFWLYGPALALLLGEFQSTFFITAGSVYYGWNSVIRSLTPFTVCWRLRDAKPVSLTSLSLADIVLLTVLFGFFAYLAYIRRPSESTGRSMVYGWFGEVIKFMLMIPCGMGVGLIFGSIQEEAEIVWWMFGLVLGTVMAKGLTEVLYELDFKAFFRKKGELAIGLGITVLLVCVFWFDLLGYDTYLPSYRKLAGIRLDAFARADFNPVYDIYEDGIQVADRSSLSRRICKDQTELGEKIYGVLEEISKTGGEGPEDRHSSTMEIQYELRSGLTVSRYYNLTPELQQKLYQACYEEGNLKELKYSALGLDEKYLQLISAAFQDNTSVALYNRSEKGASPENRTQIVQALREDVAEATPEELTEAFPVSEIVFHYNSIPLKQTVNNLVPDRTPVTNEYCSYYVYPSFHRTLAILEQAGGPMSGADVIKEYQDAELEAYVTAGDGTLYGGIPVESDADYEEIADHMIFNDFDLPWIRTVDAFVLMKSTKFPDDTTLRYIFPADQTPEFINELLEKGKNGELERYRQGSELYDGEYELSAEYEESDVDYDEIILPDKADTDETD